MQPSGSMTPLWPRHNSSDQNAQKQKYLFVTTGAALLHVRRHVLRWLRESFFGRSKTRFFKRRAISYAAGIDYGRFNEGCRLIRQAGVWRFDALVAVFFLVLVLGIVLGSARQWWQVMRGNKTPSFCTKANLCRSALRSSHNFKLRQNQTVASIAGKL